MSVAENNSKSCPEGKTMHENMCYDNSSINPPTICKNPTDVWSETQIGPTRKNPQKLEWKCVPKDVYDSKGMVPGVNPYDNKNLTFCTKDNTLLRKPLNGFNTVFQNWEIAAKNPLTCVPTNTLSDKVCDSNSILLSNGSCLNKSAKPTPLE